MLPSCSIAIVCAAEAGSSNRKMCFFGCCVMVVLRVSGVCMTCCGNRSLMLSCDLTTLHFCIAVRFTCREHECVIVCQFKCLCVCVQLSRASRASSMDANVMKNDTTKRRHSCGSQCTRVTRKAPRNGSDSQHHRAKAHPHITRYTRNCQLTEATSGAILASWTIIFKLQQMKLNKNITQIKLQKKKCICPSPLEICPFVLHVKG